MNEVCEIFDIKTEQEFERAALELFRKQAEKCPPYREYLSLIGVNPEEVD